VPTFVQSDCGPCAAVRRFAFSGLRLRVSVRFVFVTSCLTCCFLNMTPISFFFCLPDPKAMSICRDLWVSSILTPGWRSRFRQCNVLGLGQGCSSVCGFMLALFCDLLFHGSSHITLRRSNRDDPLLHMADKKAGCSQLRRFGCAPFTLESLRSIAALV
jgi:hypothetical protein